MRHPLHIRVGGAAAVASWAVRTLSKGMKNFVLSDDASFSEAMAEARSEEEFTAVSHQLDAFHQTFNFCLTCRQYTCGDCWNTDGGPVPHVRARPGHGGAGVRRAAFADAPLAPVETNGAEPAEEAWPDEDLSAARLSRALGLDEAEAEATIEAASQDADFDLMPRQPPRPRSRARRRHRPPTTWMTPRGSPRSRRRCPRTQGAPAVAGVAPGQSLADAVAEYEARIAAEEAVEAVRRRAGRGSRDTRCRATWSSRRARPTTGRSSTRTSRSPPLRPRSRSRSPHPSRRRPGGRAGARTAPLRPSPPRPSWRRPRTSPSRRRTRARRRGVPRHRARSRPRGRPRRDGRRCRSAQPPRGARRARRGQISRSAGAAADRRAGARADRHASSPSRSPRRARAGHPAGAAVAAPEPEPIEPSEAAAVAALELEHAAAPEPEPVAPEPEPDPPSVAAEPARVDVVPQPTWPQPAPANSRRPPATPHPAVPAPAPWLTVAPGGSESPQWPASPAFPRGCTTATCRPRSPAAPLLPQADPSGLWEASARDVLTGAAQAPVRAAAVQRPPPSRASAAGCRCRRTRGSAAAAGRRQADPGRPQAGPVVAPRLGFVDGGRHIPAGTSSSARRASTMPRGSAC